MKSLACVVTILLVACGDDGGGQPLPDGGSAATIDMAVDPCAQCGTGTICVQRYGGVCPEFQVECVTSSLSCPPNTCSDACQTALCPSPYQCENRPPCGNEDPDAFQCYGP